MALTEEERKKLTEITTELQKRISSKNRVLICPICSNNNFSLSEGYTHRSLSEKQKQTVLGGLVMPSVTLICNNCGYVLDFAIGTLGFLDKEGKTNGKEEKK